MAIWIGRLLKRDPNNSLNGFGAYYLTLNRNKKSIERGLKSKKGLALFYELVKLPMSSSATSVQVRPNVSKINREHLSKVNLRIITCTMVGFGERITGNERQTTRRIEVSRGDIGNLFG